MTSHFNPAGHQEAPERITRIWQAIVNAKLNLKMQWLPIRPVTKAEALLVHSQTTWDLIETFQCEFKGAITRLYITNLDDMKSAV
jgi:histone deacetylase 6